MFLKWLLIIPILISSPVISPESLTHTPVQRPPVSLPGNTVTFVIRATPSAATVVPQDTTSSISTKATKNRNGCYPEPVTPNTPTGIAGCERWGIGIASHYGPGGGVAMNFCTWTYRTSHGCGWVKVKSLQSGLTVTVPVVDFCDCYTTTPDERIIDLQWGVVESLHLNLSQGLYKVEVWPVN